MFKLAELFVSLKAEDSVLQKQLSGVKTQLTGMGVAIGTAAGNLAASAIAAASSALTGFISKGIVGASNLGESMSKVETIFGESSKVIIGLADELAEKYGLSRQSIIDAGSAIGLVGKAAGLSQQAAANMGEQLSRLAADAASFYNVPLDEALGKIRSGLVGESEPLRAFGILLSEDAVAAEAVALKLAKSTKEVSDQAKVMARQSLIVKGLGDATGDLGRTQDSTANQWRKLTGSIENAAISIGESLAPAVNAVINALTGMTGQIGSFIESSKSSIESWAQSFANAIKYGTDSWDTFIAGLAIASLKVEEFAANTIAVISVIPENLSRIGSYIAGNWRELIVDAVSAVGTAFRNLGDNLANLGSAIVAFLKDPTKGFQFNWKPLLEGFKATAGELPEMLKPALVSMDGAIAAVGEDLNKKITDRAKAAQAAAANKPAATAQAVANQTAKKAAEFKSETSDVASFALKLREGIFGQDRNEVPKQQLEEQRKTTMAAMDIAKALGQGLVARMS